MARRDRTQELMDRIAELRLEQPEVTPELIGELRSLLKERSPHVVARAASWVAELGREELTPELEAAFERRFESPVKSDPNCVAKTAIAKALLELDEDDNELFLRGARHVQLESVWGGKVDTAAELRGVCAMGLVNGRYPNASLELVRLLADSESQARIAAVRALSAWGAPGVEELLRFVVLKRDDEPEVILEAFSTLLRVAPRRSLEFVGGFAESGDAVLGESAVLALGDSRLEGAFEPLRRAWEAGSLSSSTVALALSTLRREEALDLLIHAVAESRRGLAVCALKALMLHRGDGALGERIRSAVSERGSEELEELFHRNWSGS